MSKDIRAYFQSQKPKKKVVEDDDDVIPESPDVDLKKVEVKKGQLKKLKKKRIIEDDSDEEIFTKKKEEPSKSKKNKQPEKQKLKEVNPANLFGSVPIKRTEPLVKKVKKNTETGIHSDEEFEKSLLELDANEELALKEDIIEDSQTALDSKEKVVKKEKLSPDKHDKEKKVNGFIKNEAASTSKNSETKSTFFNESISVKKEKESKTTGKNLFEGKKDTKNKDGESKVSIDTIDLTTDVIGKSEKEIEDEKMKKEEKNVSKDVIGKSKKEIENEKMKKEEKHVSKKDSKKRDFSEFAGGEDSIIEGSDEDKPKKKKKMDKSLNESVLTDEERHERKQYSAALYQKYLNRSGPKHLGAKQIPEGTPDCLSNCAFLLTGVLDSFERDEVADAIARFGGCVKNTISKKVTHLLAGEDAGPAKMAKAQELGIKILSEDEFLKMIVDNSNKANKKSKEKIDVKKEKVHNTNSKDRRSKELKINKSESHNHVSKNDERNHKKDKSPYKDKSNRADKEIKSESKSVKSEEKFIQNDAKSAKSEGEDIKSFMNKVKEPKLEIKSEKSSDYIKTEPKEVKPHSLRELTANAAMWVEKYKPQNVKQIIGQHGDASNVKKLMNWLTKWYVNRKAKLPKPSPWAKNDDGGYYKAALLSGPPGVGKTTTVALVCKELGFDMVEFNASDTRNKTLIREQIGELLTTTSLAAYAKGSTGKQAVTKKHVLVMDEVDGMSGNEDRGGMQELIALIKNASVPIICMCNDRNSQKMRALTNYCYDLRFQRPRVEQIKSAMLSICCKEGVKIPAEAMTQLIVAANQDVRQTLNLLSMWAVDTSIGNNDSLKRDAHSGRKDVKLGPWEAVRKVFSAEDHKHMSLNDKSDLFFYDYSLAPLFVQENYLSVSPLCPKHEVLERISKAADSISMGDLIDAKIRRSQAWNLLPIQAMLSSVIPGHEMAGHVAGQIQFPGWLGKNSRANKMARLCQEIHAHTRLSTSGSKSSIYLDYAPHIRDAILNPLLKEKGDGVAKSLEVLESYHLLRDDLDSLVELSIWPAQRNPMVLIDPKVKSAMTRTYNKSASALPYAPSAIKKGRGHTGDEDLMADDDAPDDGDDDDNADSDPENDALIKKKKVEKPSKSKEKASSSKEKAGSSKDKPSSSRSKKK